MTSLAETSGKGRRQALETLRDRLAADIDGCRSGRDLAALSLRYMDVLSQLEDLTRGKADDETPLSQFEARMREREGKTARGRTA